jgi:hypothetical protein
MPQKNEEPHGGSMLWLLAVLVIVVAAKVDSTVADIATLAIAGWAMKTHSAGRN